MSGPETEDQTPSTPSVESSIGSGPAPKGNYDVGYGRPPVQGRFKPGESGNPKGRPAGRPNAKTTVARVINERVAVREGEKTRRMTKLEAMLQAHAMKAMKGDARSASFVIDQEEEVLASLPNEDAEIIEDYLRRNTDSSTSGVSA